MTWQPIVHLQDGMAMERFRTRWFDLSGREVRVLLCAAGLAMLLAMGIYLARWIAWEPELTVNAARETLQRPARLDVNSALDHELMLLPGIGEGTARAIVAYRREHGPFGALEDLTKVRGIGPKTVERLRPHLMCAPQ